MKHKFEMPSVDLYSIGQETVRASKFEEMYYSMEADRDYWRDKCQEMLHQTQEHNNQMIGGLLSVALKMGEKK